MGALKLFALVATLLVASPGRAEPVADWRPLIAEASHRFGIPAAWIERVMRAESGGRTRLEGRAIVSRVGAMGLMQLMPGTWQEMQVTFGLGQDPFDPHDNIIAGTAYLRLMFDRFGYPGLFAAYNAGPGRYADYLAGRRVLPKETKAYLATVTKQQSTMVDHETAALFVFPATDAPSVDRPGGRAPVEPSSLFAILKAAR
jgi:soluble lytic murein transglycosylase-like protein